MEKRKETLSDKIAGNKARGQYYHIRDVKEAVKMLIRRLDFLLNSEDDTEMLMGEVYIKSLDRGTFRVKRNEIIDKIFGDKLT